MANRQTQRTSAAQWLSGLDRHIAARLFAHLLLIDLMSLHLTSKALHNAVSCYSAMAWNLRTFLKPWELDARSFIAKIELTAAIFSGWQTLRFQERLSPDPGRGILVLVRIGGLLTLGRHLLHAGYTMQYRGALHRDLQQLSHQVLRAAGSDSISKLEAECNSILDITFVKILDADPSSQSMGRVHIRVTNVDPIDFVVATASCTALMHVVTARQSIALYPYETFIARRSWACHADSYASMTSLDEDHRCHPTPFEIFSIFNWNPPVTIGPGSRYIGDVLCWTQSVNDEHELNEIVKLYQDRYIYNRPPLVNYAFRTAFRRWKTSKAWRFYVASQAPPLTLFNEDKRFHFDRIE